MTSRIDDPRLTAYALGEMSESDRAAFQRDIEGDEVVQAEVEAIRAFAADVESTLAAPAEAGLDDAQRAALLQVRRPRALAPWFATAALLLVGLFVFVGMMSEERSDFYGTVPEGVASLRGMADGSAGTAEPGLGPLVTQDDLFDAESVDADLDSSFEDESEKFEYEVGPDNVIREGTLPATGGRRVKLVRQYGGPGGASPPAQRLDQLRDQPNPGGAGASCGSAGSGLGGSSPGGSRPGGQATTAGWGGGGQAGAGSTVLLKPAPGPVINRLPALVTPGASQAGESYEPLQISGYLQTRKHHTSTFSIDVDTASYSNARRMLNAGSLPPPNAVRLEELINYFDYGYAPPEEGAATPFRTHVQIAQCPWTPKHRLARIALKGRVVQAEKRPAANLVFLVDVSGSMGDEDKLPLLKTGLELLTENLASEDRVGIVTYAGQAGVALESTAGSDKQTILGAIRSLRSGGSTNGEAGIQVAYEMAAKAKAEHSVNRVILCTDGDFNVGMSETSGLVQLIQGKAKSGVFLSVLGFGTGNYKDAKMEALSNKGNGNYAYIDGQSEAKRVLVEQMNETLVTIAKDVKVQVFFNPKRVQGYRLLGYENRRLAARDFNDDKKDAGEIGAGHAVTALYEIVPTGLSLPGTVDPNPFVGAGTPKKPEVEPAAKALFRLRVRWKAPAGQSSSLIEQDVVDVGLRFEQADGAFQWAAAVAGYGMLLRRSPHAGDASWDLVEELATGAKGEDPKGRRAEFLDLVGKAKGHFLRRR